tara:strand:- start:166 stop:504 length:339 start_codon:yes stop_codon:yes gene_type:complete
MQLHLAEIKAQGGHIGAGVLTNGSHQGSKRLVLVQLPEAIDVAGPGTTWFGIALRLAPQLDHLLHPLGQLQRIGLQLDPGQGQGEKSLKIHAVAEQAESNHKKTGPEGPVSA